MTYSIQSKMIKDKSNLQNYVFGFSSDKDLTVKEIKEVCKNKFNRIPEYKDYISKEYLYLGNNEKTNDQEVIKPKSGLEYNLVFEKVAPSGSVANNSESKA